MEAGNAREGSRPRARGTGTGNESGSMAAARGAYNPRPMTSSADPLGLTPGSCVRGRCVPPGSKSLAQRALLAAALARGRTTLEGLSEGDDVRAALALLPALGVAVERQGATRATVSGARSGEASQLVAAGPLEVGESGTLARLVTAVVALAGRPGGAWTISARGTLLFRKSAPLFAALGAAGVEYRRQNLPGTWPVELLSATPPREVRLVGPVSSQEVSGLLLALSAHAQPRTLIVRGAIPSEPYLAMTLGVLADFGASVECTGSGVRRFEVRGPLVAPASPYVLEPDASSAAVALAAACLSGGAVLVPGLGPDSPQGDVRAVEHLAAFGCAASFEPEGLSAAGFPTRGAALGLEGEPDLAPVLAAVAAGAALRHGATSTLSGLGTLPGKESDRLAVLAEGLRAIGCTVEATADSLRIAPGGRPAPARVLDPRGDHRMAFAFALLGLLVPDVTVRDPGCVAKSWSSFWDDLVALGAGLRSGTSVT